MATSETVMVAVMTALGCEADDGEDDRKVTVVTVKAMTTKVAGAKMPPQRTVYSDSLCTGPGLGGTRPRSRSG